MTFEEFYEHVATELRLDPASGRRDLHLLDDLMLDSLEVMEFSVVMYELGAEVPEELMPFLATMDDWYDHYLIRVGPDRTLTEHRRELELEPISIERTQGWKSRGGELATKFRDAGERA